MKKILCKVCGLTRHEDVMLCDSLGVDFTGFIFVPSSPRAVSPISVGGIPLARPKRVGVFAGASLDEMRTCAQIAHLDFFQLHGGENYEVCATLGPERVIKVLWPQKCTLEELQKDMELFAPVCSYFLLDAGHSGGGSGNCLDFQYISQITSPKPWFLAGGLGDKTLQSALFSCKPDGVDLNSKQEISPGIKDHKALHRSMAIIKKLSV